MQLHGSLQDLRQGDESVTQFMQKAKPYLMNWPLLVGQFRLKISIYMCFVVFGESLKT
jgi:hypothetical protein